MNKPLRLAFVFSVGAVLALFAASPAAFSSAELLENNPSSAQNAPRLDFAGPDSASASPVRAWSPDSDSLPFRVAEVFPAPNTHSARVTTTVLATYTQSIDPDTVNPETFAVHAMQTGILTETYGVHGSTICLTPTLPLKPGEFVQVSATTATLTLSGTQPVSPTMWTFRADALGGSAVFSDTGQRLGNDSTSSVAVADLDRDGDLDAMVTRYRYLPMANEVWLNQGTGQFVDSGQALGESESRGLAFGDLDADGDLDAFTANHGQPNRVWLNDGYGSFSASGQALGTAYSYAVALGDLDGDGDLDALVANGGDDVVWLNSGSAHFSRAQVLVGAIGGRDVGLGDLDGDHDLDAFIANVPELRVWLNNGDGRFVDSGQRLGTRDNLRSRLGDLDGDGDLDAYVTKTNNWPHEVWLNNGTASFTKTEQELGDLNGTKRATLGDLDGDGDLDAFVATFPQWSGAPYSNRIWLNDGQANFVDSGQTLGNHPTYSIALGDLDLDGDLDAFAGNTSEDYVWFNRNQPDFELGKKGPSAGLVRRPITYTLSVTNTGQLPATGLTITDTVPEGANYLRGGTEESGVVSWTVESLEPGSSMSVQFSVTAATPQTLVNDDYYVVCEAGYRAKGSVPVTTVVADVPISGLVATNDSPTPLGEPTLLTATVNDGTNVSYTWKLDEQQMAHGASVSHSYSTGFHTAVVTAVNSVSQVTATTTITVDETIGGLVAASDSPTAVGDTTTLTAAVSAGSNVSYSWNLGDGHSAVGDVIHHSYPSAGVYTPATTAANSVSSQSADVIVSVDAPIEGIIATIDEPALAGRATTLTASVKAGTSISYAWSLGDGSEAEGEVVKHTYLAPGSYPVVVTATNWINLATASTNIDILNAVYLPALARRWPPVPYTPELNEIRNPEQDGHYSVTWQEAELADSYALQEATDISFSEAQTIYQGSNRSWSVPAPGRMPGTYYYRVKARNSWGDSAWSSVESTVVTHAELIVNGGFETGPPAPPWVQGSTSGLELIDELGARTGDWGVYMGGLTSVFDQIYQTVTIPVTAESPQLSYWRLIRTADSPAEAYDEMRCFIGDTNGDVLALCGKFTNVDQSKDWINETYDLSRFKGQTIDVGFAAVNDEVYDTQFFIDDVSLMVSSAANAEAEGVTAVAEPDVKWLSTEAEEASTMNRDRERQETQRPFHVP